jgi:hypothetical protein
MSAWWKGWQSPLTGRNTAPVASRAASPCGTSLPTTSTSCAKLLSRLAGLSDKPVLQSGEVRGEAIEWLTAKRQFSDGLKQAAGGARQIAIVHRGDAMWLKIARQIDQLADSTKRSPILQPRLAPGGLLLPPGQFSRAVH